MRSVRSVGFLVVLVLAVVLNSSVSVMADEVVCQPTPVKCLACQTRDCLHAIGHGVGHVTKTVVIRMPVAVLETGGDAIGTTGLVVNQALRETAGWWQRAGDRMRRLFK